MSTTPSAEPPVPQPRDLSLRRRVISLPTLLSFALAVAFLLFLFIGFDIHFDETWQSARSSDPASLLLAFTLFYITIPLRGYRWRLLMKNADVFRQANARTPSTLAHSEMMLINLFANSISWFRVGDAYRAFLMSSRFKVSFSGTIGTILAERILNTGTVVALFIIAWVALLRSDLSTTVRSLAAVAIALLAAMGATILAMRLFGLRLARRLPRRLQSIYVHFHNGAIGSFRKLPWPAAVSGAIALLMVARLYFVIQALNYDVSFALILFAAVAPALLLAIPLTPGGLGLVELGLVGVLVLAPNLDLADATAITLVDRSITYLSVLVIGGSVFAIRHMIEVRRASLGNRTSPSQ